MEEAQYRLDIMTCYCRIIWADDKCDGKESLGRLVEIHDNYDIDGVLGLPCSFGNRLELNVYALWIYVAFLLKLDAG